MTTSLASGAPPAGRRESILVQRLLEFLDRRGGWIAMPAGILLAAAFAPTGLAPLAVVCPALLFLLWQDVRPRVAAWRGFLFTGGTFLAGTYWLYHSIHLVGCSLRPWHLSPLPVKSTDGQRICSGSLTRPTG